MVPYCDREPDGRQSGQCLSSPRFLPNITNNEVPHGLPFGASNGRSVALQIVRQDPSQPISKAASNRSSQEAVSQREVRRILGAMVATTSFL